MHSPSRWQTMLYSHWTDLTRRWKKWTGERKEVWLSLRVTMKRVGQTVCFPSAVWNF